MYNTKQDLIESILVKLDQRVKSVKDFRFTINDVSNVDDLKNQKKELNKHFFEVEDEIRQSVQFIKALLIQNKDFSEMYPFLVFCRFKVNSSLKLMVQITNLHSMAA